MSPEKRIEWEHQRRRGYLWYVIGRALLAGFFLSYVPGLVAIGILGKRNGWHEFIAVHAITAVLLFMVFWYIRHREWNMKQADYLESARDSQESLS